MSQKRGTSTTERGVYKNVKRRTRRKTKKNQKNNDKELKIENGKLKNENHCLLSEDCMEVDGRFFRLKIARYIRNNSRKVSNVSW